MENQKEIIISLKKEYFVDPFIIQVQPGDTIVMKSTGKTKATVVIPTIKAFADIRQKENYIEHRFPTDGELIIKVRKYPIFGTYIYHVYLVEPDEFADKPNHSAPKIIIKE